VAEQEPPTEVIRAPTGTHDVLWPESSRWESLLALFSARARRAGFGLVLTPMFEDARLFRRGIGDESDVVTKEMYEFTDRGGRSLALRPEGTASVVRAFVQHHPPTPWKAWYATQAFRYERPQAGRYRQHHQLGVEVLGTEDADLDVEVIALAAGFYAELGLARVELSVNSMGCADDRPGYIEALKDFLAGHAGELCDEHRDRYAVNPLRVLDCKRDPCRVVTETAPRLIDYLDESCATHFGRVLAGLDALDIRYRIEPRLVRGLDYYTRTTFEFAGLALDAAQNAVGGGGRYDGLSEAIGGPATSGIGFGIGVERLLLACDAEGCFPVAPRPADAFVIDLTGDDQARDLVDELRRSGLTALRAYDGRSPKSQMKQADKSGARFAVIIGPDELSEGVVTLRPLRDDGGQESVGRPDIVARLWQLSNEGPIEG
jgi:histidyl-tRNA synthetase